MATETQTLAVETTHLRIGHSSSKAPNTSTKGTKNRLRLDPLRALEPVHKKLSTIEAQRVMAVLEETKKRVEIVTLLPWLVKNMDRFSIILGSELVGILDIHRACMQSHQDLETSIKKLIDRKESGDREDMASIGSRSRPNSRPGSRPSTRPNSSHSERPGSNASLKSNESTTSLDDQLENAVRNLGLIEQQLSHSTKNVIRAFTLNPAAVTAVREEFKNRSREAANLINTSKELKDILMEKLLTTPTEEQEKIQYLVQVTQQERRNAIDIGKLETELNVALEDKDNEIKKKNDVIRGLQSNLHAIEKYSDETIRRTKSEADKQEAADNKNSDGKRQKLMQEVNQLTTQLQNLITEHREEEQNLRKKKYKIETEVENWIQKYDQDMGDRQDEFEEIDTVYTKEKKQLHELEERFKTLEEEYTKITEERRIAREKREAAEREMQLMVKAATTVQAFWRSYKVRKALKSKKKGKKGKGKK